MGLFDWFRKKTAPAAGPTDKRPDGAAAQKPAAQPAASPNADRLDDVTFIREMKHLEQGPWQQYDVLLAARGYGWAMMLDWADYLAAADIQNVSQVITSTLGGPEQNVTDSYLEHGGQCRGTPELQMENGVLSIAGVSRTLTAPMKVVWFSQTQVLRFFTFVDDELTIRKYVETVIRRTFGTDKAMKLAKDIPAGR